MSEPISTVKSRAEQWLEKTFPTCERNGRQAVVMARDGHDDDFDFFVYQDLQGKRCEMEDILNAYAKSVIESLAEEAEREVHGCGLDGCKETQWYHVAAWLRSKGVEQRAWIQSRGEEKP